RPNPTLLSASPTSPARGTMTATMKPSATRAPTMPIAMRRRDVPPGGLSGEEEAGSAVGFDPVPGRIAELLIVRRADGHRREVHGSGLLHHDGAERSRIGAAARAEARPV